MDAPGAAPGRRPLRVRFWLVLLVLLAVLSAPIWLPGAAGAATWLVVLLFCAAAAYVLRQVIVAALGGARDELILTARGRTTTGALSRLVRVEDEHDGGVQRWEATFRDHTGRQHVVRLLRFGRAAQASPVGTPVRVRFDPQHPERADADVSPVWRITNVLVGLATAAGLLGLVGRAVVTGVRALLDG
ncbi:DUF3592 domain-containing protein [Kineosporia sp. R_H_3]|uniref:DUF3592 domain-containing protein n=1 Tax=Kineosporia sp. R_H_3 TaxID=1961848 RepID=UPI000B4AA5F0|nr:DUF3592 domain-containing protein [Kineosporia sp. R_H_3]